jgi:hypothetical protein
LRETLQQLNGEIEGFNVQQETPRAVADFLEPITNGDVLKEIEKRFHYEHKFDPTVIEVK